MNLDQSLRLRGMGSEHCRWNHLLPPRGTCALSPGHTQVVFVGKHVLQVLHMVRALFTVEQGSSRHRRRPFQNLEAVSIFWMSAATMPTAAT